MKQLKLNTTNSFCIFWTMQTSADTRARFANIKEDGDLMKIVSSGKLLEKEFPDKCYKE